MKYQKACEARERASSFGATSTAGSIEEAIDGRRPKDWTHDARIARITREDAHRGKRRESLLAKVRRARRLSR